MTQHLVQTYLELLNKSEEEVVKLLSEDFEDQSHYSNAINPVAITWLISFIDIQKHYSLAAIFLSFMACLYEKGIPLSLLSEADSKIDVIKTIIILTGYSFVTKHTDSSSMPDVKELYNMHQLMQLIAQKWLKIKGTLSK